MRRIQVVGSTDGLPSDPLPVNINAPWQVFGYLSFQGSYNNSGTGYQSDYSYILYDTAGFAITVPITLHETLENCLPYSGSNWCTYTEHPGTWPPSYWSSGQFVDQYTAQVGQGLSPSPIVPQTPLGSTKALDNTQKFFVGSPGDPNNVLNIFTGMCVQRNRLQMYQDHGAKDIATSPVASGLCAQGQFGN